LVPPRRRWRQMGRPGGERDPLTDCVPSMPFSFGVTVAAMPDPVRSGRCFQRARLVQIPMSQTDCRIRAQQYARYRSCRGWVMEFRRRERNFCYAPKCERAWSCPVVPTVRLGCLIVAGQTSCQTRLLRLTIATGRTAMGVSCCMDCEGTGLHELRNPGTCWSRNGMSWSRSRRLKCPLARPFQSCPCPGRTRKGRSVSSCWSILRRPRPRRESVVAASSGSADGAACRDARERARANESSSAAAAQHSREITRDGVEAASRKRWLISSGIFRGNAYFRRWRYSGRRIRLIDARAAAAVAVAVAVVAAAGYEEEAAF
jgi:hypothetical protein